MFATAVEIFLIVLTHKSVIQGTILIFFKLENHGKLNSWMDVLIIVEAFVDYPLCSVHGERERKRWRDLVCYFYEFLYETCIMASVLAIESPLINNISIVQNLEPLLKFQFSCTTMM